MKVEQFMNRNQFHLYGEGVDILQSYDSKVVEIRLMEDGVGYLVTLGRDWDYSTTTSKHVYAFLEKYLPYGFGIDFRKAKGNKRKYLQSKIDDHTIGYDANMY